MSEDAERFSISCEARIEPFEIGFRKIFGEIGLKPETVKQHGAFCTDVEGGSEVTALVNLGVSSQKIVASEPVLRWVSEERAKSEPFITGALEGLKRRGVEVIRKFPDEAMREIKNANPGLKFGIVTRLNVFPESQGPTDIVNFIEQASEFVVSGGCVLVSASENDAYTVGRFEKAAGISRKELPDWEIRNIEMSSVAAVAGRVFLAAKHPK